MQTGLIPVFKNIIVSIFTENLITTKMKKKIQKADAWIQAVLLA